jgi:hypothetical protein
MKNFVPRGQAQIKILFPEIPSNFFQVNFIPGYIIILADIFQLIFPCLFGNLLEQKVIFFYILNFK